MLLTPLRQLRKDAPGSLTGAKMAVLLQKRGLKRIGPTVNAFERGQLKEPNERFVELYAEIIGQTVETVRNALKRTLKMRESGSGPFVDRRVA